MIRFMYLTESELSSRGKVSMRFSSLFFTASLILPSQAFAWTSWVGVLEDWPLQSDAAVEPGKPFSKAEPKYEARVRPLFIRVDKTTWQAAPALVMRIQLQSFLRPFRGTFVFLVAAKAS